MPQSRLLNPSGMAVSIVTHLTVLTVGLGYAGVRPFETLPVEAIAVDIVSPAEVKEATPETPLKPTPPLEIPDLATMDQPAAASKPAAPPPAPQAVQREMPATASATPPKADAKQAAIQPAAATSSSASQPTPSWRPPEPDLSVKYQVNLGLPARPGDDFDTVAFTAAKVSTDNVAKFREHLRTCSALPASVAPTDKVTIRLRASFLPDGTLASAPLLIEASASAKGPLLMQAAIEALAACQPYAVLPADKYNEWKVLDLSFTPRDFRGG
ncbi:MAG TPA: hypothetical protein VGO49_23685 [Bradyrhizobium sp.]|nr:hypothetical protein [Bradyrhizobium sp.]